MKAFIGGWFLRGGNDGFLFLFIKGYDQLNILASSLQSREGMRFKGTPLDDTAYWTSVGTLHLPRLSFVRKTPNGAALLWASCSHSHAARHVSKALKLFHMFDEMYSFSCFNWTKSCRCTTRSQDNLGIPRGRRVGFAKRHHQNREARSIQGALLLTIASNHSLVSWPYLTYVTNIANNKIYCR